MSDKEKTILENLGKSLSKATDSQSQVSRCHMGCVITIHHPNLTEQERKYRMEQIKQATIQFFIEEEKQKSNKKMED